MPLDVLKQIDEEKKALTISGDNTELLNSLNAIQEKAGNSSEVLSVLDSIIKSMTSSGKCLHDCLSDVVKDFEAYDKIASQSRKETASLRAEYAVLGMNGEAGISRINISLTQSLSLLRTVEREVKKFDNVLSGLSSPAIGVPSAMPVQRFANGGRISGTSKSGDKNLARVNAGEWVFTERQMDRLKKELGVKSHSDVFRVAGGNPSQRSFDNDGIQKFAHGGLRARTQEQQISSARNDLEARYTAKGTHSGTKRNIEAADEALERFNDSLKRISNEDYNRLGIEKSVNSIFKSISNGATNTNKGLQSLTTQINAVISAIEADEEATRQRQLALDSIIDVDLSRFSGDALIFAENLEKAKKIAESSAATQQEKENARKDVNSSKTMLDFSQQKYLTKAQRKQRSDIIEEYKNASSSEEREKIAQKAADLGNMDNVERSIGLFESGFINLEKRADAFRNSINESLGGTVTGFAAVAIATGVAIKAVSDFVNSMASSVEATAKLCAESSMLKASFNSTFGEGTFDNFRKELGLTRAQMAELRPVITDAYREAGVQMEQVAEVAKNIRDEIGAMDPKMLNEALSVMKELTSEQVDILMKGSGSSEDRANMYANLMESGKAGQAADLLEQGIFGGENLSANVSDGDKEIIKNLQMIKRVEEDANVLVEKGFGMFASSIPFAKGVSAIIGIGGGVFQGLVTLKAIQGLVAQKKATDAAGNVGKGAGSGGGMGNMAGGLIATAMTAAAVAGFKALADHFESEKRVKEEKKEKEISDNYNQTGVYAGEADLKVDWDAVNARGARYAAWGAGIGGVIGGTAGGIAGAGAGTVVPVLGNFSGATFGAIKGASIGIATGSAIGYGTGIALEMNKQLGDKADNPFLFKEGKEGVLLKRTIEGIIDMGGLTRPLNAIVGGIIGFTKGSKENAENYNAELLECASETNANLAAIRDINQKRRESEVRSLRTLESAGIVVKKIKSGAYTRFQDKQADSAKKNIELMGYMGGNADSYSNNVSSILNNSTTSFTKNISVLEAELKKVTEKEEISAEARIVATQNLLDEQAEITKKFCEAIYNSIGEYNKIPSVIQHSLQSKINSMFLDLGSQNVFGTSEMSLEMTSEDLANAFDDLKAATEQYYNELPKAKEAQAAAEKTYKDKVNNFAKQQEGFRKFGFKDIVTNGKIDSKSIEENRGILNEKKQKLYQMIEKKTGIENFSITQSAIDDLKSESTHWKNLDDSLKDMDEEKWKVNGEEHISKMIDNAKSSQEKLRAIVDNEGIDEEIREKAKKSLAANEEGLKKLQEIQENWKNGKTVKLDQAKGIGAIFSSAEQTATTEFERSVAEVKNMPVFKNKIEQLGKVETMLNSASNTQDAKTMGAKNDAKMLEGLTNVIKNVQIKAEQMLALIKHDPTLNFYKAQEENLVAQKDYLMATGGYSKYLTGTLESMSSQMNSQKAIVDKMKSEYAKLKGKSDNALHEVLKKSGNSKQAQEMVNSLEELNKLRAEAMDDPTKNELVAQKEAEINKKLETITDPEVKKQFQAAIAVLSASNDTLFEIKKEENKTRSMQFAQFKKMIDMMGEYKNTLEYMAVGAAQGRITAQSGLASANLDAGSARALAKQSRTANIAQYELDMKGIEEERAAALSKLDKDEAAAKASDDTNALESIDKQRSIVENNAAQKTAEAVLNYQKKQAEAAKQEYDVKMKIVDIANRNLDIQLDLAQTIGAPMETVVALERQRVQLAQDAARAAEVQYRDMLRSGASQEDIEEAKLKMHEAQAKVIKDSMGTQRSMMEKIFGNMIGSFTEVAGIMGPHNLAGKYGMGYMTDASGSNVRRGSSEYTEGYEGRKFANGGDGGSSFGAPERDSSVLGSSPYSPIKKGKGSKGGTGKTPSKGAGGTTRNDNDFNTLGESFKNEKEGIEMAVFWEKKIYNLLDERLRVNSGTQTASGTANPIPSIPQSPMMAAAQRSQNLPQPPTAAGTPAPAQNQTAPQVIPQQLAGTGNASSVRRRRSRGGSERSGSPSTQNLQVEVQVKFNNSMFENQVARVATSPSIARSIVSTGMGKA